MLNNKRSNWWVHLQQNFVVCKFMFMTAELNIHTKMQHSRCCCSVCFVASFFEKHHSFTMTKTCSKINYGKREIAWEKRNTMQEWSLWLRNIFMRFYRPLLQVVPVLIHSEERRLSKNWYLERFWWFPPAWFNFLNIL